MNQFLMAVAVLFTGVFAQATTYTCYKQEHRYAKITAVIRVDRDEDTDQRVLSSDLFMNESAVGTPENNCNSRRCFHTSADATYTIYPHFRRGTDQVVGVTMSARSPIIVYEEYLGRCITEDEAG